VKGRPFGAESGVRSMTAVNESLMSCQLCNGDETAERPEANIGGSVMSNFSIAVLSAAEFETARKLISGLSAHASYDDWLDCRYGAFMGRSLGGDNAQLLTVSLGSFLEWCDYCGLCPSESTLDAFALHSARGRNVQAVESSAASVRSAAPSTDLNPRSISLSHGPKSASRSIGADL
jgi:hypothetical protein